MSGTGDLSPRQLSPRQLSYEDAEREAIQMEAYEAEHREAVELEDAKHWRAGRAQGVLASPVSKIEAERRRKRP